MNLKECLVNGGFTNLKKNLDGSFNASRDGENFKRIRIEKDEIVYVGSNKQYKPEDE